MKSVIVPSVQSPPSMLKLHDFCNRAHTSIEHSRD
ncbi:NTP-binding protein, partial [Klebsiella pneumoniae]|nr:NTP-binding protein [Klebsiella pneumoniae]